MCGIAGCVYLNGQNIRRQVIKAMTGVLTHRGPDDGGYEVWGPVALGNRRLAILDLSSAGHQPMPNEDGTLWLVYNGEIYNFLDLRRELERLGHRFRSQTDTEVILHAYEEWGPECVRRFNGMFALALWDQRQKRLFLARDPLGVKPLFYSWNGKVLRFGSEIKALLADPEVTYSLDETSLHLFLTFYYVPPPRTLFRTVCQLLPGHIILLDLEQHDLRVIPYWDWQPQDIDEGLEEQYAYYAYKLESLLDQAVRRALVSDVPFGLFLSGGLDSSTVLHFMVQALQKPVQTFSIGFEDPSYSELEAARQVAQHYRTLHHERVVTASEVIEVLPRLVWHADEPLADASLVPTYFVSQLAREQVKMVLSGDGGDELFAGYETYTAYFLARAYQRLPRAMRRMLRRTVERLPVSYRKYSLEMKAKRFVYAADLPPEELHAAWRVAWREDQKWRIYTPEFTHKMRQVNPFAVFAEYMRRPQTESILNRLLYADLRLYLPGDMLAKVDRASMAHALEVRVPLLDVALVEFMAQVPPRFKLYRWMQKKYLLRKVMSRYLPPRVLQRPKQGFVIPVSAWLRGPLREFAASVLLDGTLYRTGLLNKKGVEAIWREHLQGKQDHGYALWTLMVLGLWLHLFFGRRNG